MAAGGINALSPQLTVQCSTAQPPLYRIYTSRHTMIWLGDMLALV